MQCVQCLFPLVVPKRNTPETMFVRGCRCPSSAQQEYLQVDDTLLVLSTACKCSLMDLISQHSTALMKLLQPLPEDLHAAADLIAYSHLLLPSAAISHALQAAATTGVMQPQLPQLPQSFYAEVHEQHVE